MIKHVLQAVEREGDDRALAKTAADLEFVLTQLSGDASARRLLGRPFAKFSRRLEEHRQLLRHLAF